MSGAAPGADESDAALEGAVDVEVGADVAERVESIARGFVDRLVAGAGRAGDLDRAIRAIDGLGEREIAATTLIASRYADRPIRALEDMLADRSSLSRHLRELGDASSKLLRRESADVSSQLAEMEDRIRATSEALDADRGTLEADNAALDQQEQALWREIETLRQYAYLAARLDALLDERITAITERDPGAGRALRLDALFAVRRRRRDLLLQLAVATQGYGALRLVEQDNLQVIWAIRAATTTAVTALRTALLAAQATRRRPAASAGRDPDELATVVRDAVREMQAALDEVESRRRATLEAVRGGPQP